MLFVTADFFSNSTFSKDYFRKTECQTDWIQIRPDVLSGVIWEQSICKSLEETILEGNEFRKEQTRKKKVI